MSEQEVLYRASPEDNVPQFLVEFHDKVTIKLGAMVIVRKGRDGGSVSIDGRIVKEFGLTGP